MKRYVVQELWGGILNDDLEFEASDKKQAIKKYLLKREFKNAKVYFDCLKNHVQNSSHVICVQEGHYENDTKWIRGKRHFYKIVLPEITKE